MKPDSMLIEPGHIVTARQEIGERGNPESLEDLAKREPALAAYISESMASLAGKLALSGAPTPVVQGLYNEALAVLLSSVEAQRRGHYDLWKGTIVGTQIEKLNNPPKKPRAKPRGRPRKKPGADEKAE
ncbi:MAG: hypothetical protein ACKO23_19615 [Gemmataceae bacterium]